MPKDSFPCDTYYLGKYTAVASLNGRVTKAAKNGSVANTGGRSDGLLASVSLGESYAATPKMEWMNPQRL